MVSANTKIAFIGGGNMAQAMIAGYIKSGVPATNILVCTPSPETRLNLVEKFGINVAEKNTFSVHFADVIFLAVKPKLTAYVCRELSAALKASGEQKLLVSMAAGMTLDYLRSQLDQTAKVAVIMPNLPTAQGEGVIGVIADDSIPKAEREMLGELIGLLGLTMWLDSQEQLHNIVAASGSAPAYIFLFLEAMVESATKLGLTRKQANAAVIQTGLGAINMAAESEMDFKALREKVTSPNGTTEQAINNFKSNNIEQIVHEAMSSAAKRSKLMEAAL